MNQFSQILFTINHILNITVFGRTIGGVTEFNCTVGNILLSLIVFFALFFIVKFGLKHLGKLIDKISNTKEKKALALLESIKKLPKIFWIFIELFVACKFLKLPINVDFVINKIFLLVIIFGSTNIIIKLSKFFIDKILSGNKSGQKTIELIVNILVRVVGIIIFLTNIGVNLTPLVASLGVASIAVAFALQNILSDLFASFSILFSKPFVIGDYIEVGSFEGTVKSITLKSTLLQNTAGQDVIIPNGSILTNNVVNYGKAKFRRQRPIISVTYSTSIKYLKEIPEIIGNIIKSIDGVEFEWCHFQKMNDYSLDFLCSYKSLSPDYTKMLEVNEQIYLGILNEFEKKGIELAFPTQTVYTIQQK